MISYNKVDGGSFTANNNNSLLKISSNAGFTPVGQNIIRNEDPQFQNYFTQKMNLRVKTDSKARNNGNPSYNDITKKDIVGITRPSNQPTIGAYQYQ